MLTIRIGTEYLQLEKRSAISLEMNASIFEDEIFKGSYSAPINFAYSEHNLRLLNFRHLVQNVIRLEQPIKVNLDINGNFYKSALLRLDFSSSKKISGYLQIDYSAAAELLNSTKLKNVYLGGDRYIGNSYPTKVAHFNAMAPASSTALGDYTFAPIYNPEFYKKGDDSTNPDFTNGSGVLNFFQDNTFVSDSISFGSPSSQVYSFVPLISVTYLIRKCCEQIGYRAIGSFLENIEIATLVMPSFTAIDKISTLPHGTYNVQQEYLNLSNHVPDITISEFFREIRNTFFCHIEVNSTANTIEFKLLREVINDSRLVDWSGDIVNDLEYIKLDKRSVEIAINPDSEDELFETNEFVREYKYGDQNEDSISYEINASPLYMLRQEDPLSTFRQLLPEARQIGNSVDSSIASTLEQNKFGLRFLFYRGRRNDGNGDTYPLASSDVYDYAGNQIASYSLFWSGENGLRNAFGKDYLYFRTNCKLVRFEKFFTENELINFKASNRIYIENLRGFVSQIKVSSDFKNKPAIIEAYVL